MAKKQMKKFMAVVLALSVLCTSGLVGKALALSENYVQTFVYGDVNVDGKITAQDSLLVLRTTLNLTSFNENQKLIADVNQDGKITASDSLAILRYAVMANGGGKTGEEFTVTSNNENTSSNNTSSRNTSSNSTSSHSTSSNSTSSNSTSSRSTSSNSTSSRSTSSNSTSSHSTSSNNTSSRSTNNTSSVTSPEQAIGQGHGNYMIALNTQTKKYHTQNCPYVNKISLENRYNYYVEVAGGTVEDCRHIESCGYDLCKYCEKYSYSPLKR